MANVIHKRLTFKTGEYIFRTGDAPTCAYLIQSGEVDIVVGTPEAPVVVNTLHPGEIVGEMALVDNQPRSAGARARGPTTCILVSREDFKKRMERADPLVRAMLRMLVNRLRKAIGPQVASAN
jgi:CRP-like cAMP-binding protein